MLRKFISGSGSRDAKYPDDFFGVEVGHPTDEAVCRLSDIDSVLMELDAAREGLRRAQVALRYGSTAAERSAESMRIGDYFKKWGGS